MLALYNAIETALSGQERPVVQFVAVSSSAAGAWIAYDLAWVAAALIGKRILFIDASQAGILPRGAKAKASAMQALVPMPQDERGTVVKIDGAELYVVDLGHASDPAGCATIVRQVRDFQMERFQAFDMIVVAGPSGLQDPLSSLIARSVNGNVLIVEAEVTRASAARKLKALLESAGRPVLGVVMTERRHRVPWWMRPFV
jgi:Mrp family chromosome partitioning ATPase